MPEFIRTDLSLLGIPKIYKPSAAGATFLDIFGRRKIILGSLSPRKLYALQKLMSRFLIIAMKALAWAGIG